MADPAPPVAPLRVILADDATVIRQGLARLLTDAGVDVVTQVDNAADLLTHVDLQPPHVAIVDIKMPRTYTDEELVAARQIRANPPGVGVLVLSQYIDAAYATKLITDGAERVGYL